MSFVTKKLHIFDTSDNVQSIKQRSCCRLKTYKSATDLRSWSNSQEDHRQYILELINQDYIKPTYWGNYVPIPDLFNILMKAPRSEIVDSENEIDDLKEAEYIEKEDDDNRNVEKLAASPRKTPIVDNEAILLLSRAVTELEKIKSIVIKPPDNRENYESDPINQQNRLSERVSSISNKSELCVIEDNDLNSLKQRLFNLKNLPTLVRALKNKSEAYEKFNRNLENQLNDPLKNTKKSNNYEQDNQNLLEKNKKLEKEIDNLNYKLEQTEKLRIELNCLKDRLNDLCRLQRDYDDLKRRTYDYDDIKADLLYFKDRCEKLRKLQEEFSTMQSRLKQMDMLEHERQLLIEEIDNCQCYIAHQKDEIQQLTCYVHNLEEQLDLKQEEIKSEVSSMRVEIDKKDELLCKSQMQLDNCVCELKNTIRGLNKEVTTLRTQAAKYERKLNDKKQEICCLKQNLQRYEAIFKEKLQIDSGDQHYQSIMVQTRTILGCLIHRLRQDED